MNKIKSLLLSFVTQIQKIAQMIGKPEPLITDEQYFLIKKEISEGDVLLSRENYRLTALFIPGRWKHAAIYSNGYIYEAIKEGVKKTSLERFILSKDHLCHLKPMFAFHQSFINPYLNLQVGKKYDYNFNTSDQEAFYCSELCAAGLEYAFIPTNEVKEFPIKPLERLGHFTVTPQDFYFLATTSSKGLFVIKSEFNN